MEIFNLSKTIVDFFDIVQGNLKKNPRHCWILYCEDNEFIDLNRSSLIVNITEKFQGNGWGAGAYLFFNEQKAKEALEWIESEYIAYKLIGDNNKKLKLTYYQRIPKLHNGETSRKTVEKLIEMNLDTASITEINLK